MYYVLCVPSGHYATWGEDLVLAVRPGEIIPSYGLRDTEQALGREQIISGYGRSDHKSRHWAGSYYYSVISLVAHYTHTYDMNCDMLPEMIYESDLWKDLCDDLMNCFMAC